MLKLILAICVADITPSGPIGSRGSMQRWIDWSRRRFDERGASLVEYSLLLAMIAVVCIGAITFFGGEVSEVYSGAGSSFN